MLLDRDDDDCLELKDRMEQAAITSGMRTKSIAPAEPYVVVNRLAIEELEAWYFGDWTRFALLIHECLKVFLTKPNTVIRMQFTVHVGNL